MAVPVSRALRPPFRIFVGGPMTSEDIADGSGLSLSVHLENLLTAVKTICDEINVEYKQKHPDTDYDVITAEGPPSDTPGSIPEDVFKIIDEADFAILDLSGGAYRVLRGNGSRATRTIFTQASPNVVYELALLHGLGTPVLPITVKGHGDFFYIKHEFHKDVINFHVHTLIEALRVTVKNIFDKGATKSQGLNIISRYYKDIPLVDISSTMGLATGYYHNFLRHLIDTETSIFWNLEQIGLKDLGINKIVILKPDNLPHNEKLRTDLLNLLERNNRKLKKLQDGGDKLQNRREFNIEYIDNYIVDFTRPLSAMASSPRYRRARALRADTSDAFRAEGIATLDKYDQQIIQGFERAIRQLCEDEVSVDINFCTFKTLAQFAKELGLT